MRRFSWTMLLAAVLLAGCGGYEGAVDSQALVTPGQDEPSRLDRSLGWHLQQKLVHADADHGDVFGFSVAFAGDLVAVGAPGHDNERGAVYVFVGDGATWSLQAMLTASDGESGDAFGHSVAISGLTVVVGAIDDAVGSNPARAEQGSVYVFVRDGGNWSEQARLTASDGASWDHFGNAVAIDGDTVIVGAEDHDLQFSDAGAAYVFARNGSSWTQQAKLVGPASANSHFGHSVAISGARAAVGSPAAQGQVYEFRRSGTDWTQQAVLTPPDGPIVNEFGASLSYTSFISGGIFYNYLLVGAPSDDVGSHQAQGSVYGFWKSAGPSWNSCGKFSYPNGKDYASFGVSLATDGRTVVVGAMSDDIGNNESQGSAQVFEISGCTFSHLAELVAPDGDKFDTFGSSVAISGDTVVVGSRFDDIDDLYDQGSAYVFKHGLELGDTCNVDGECVSGHCVDGVCCDTSCGGGATNDCQACSVATGADENGVCSPTSGNSCDDGYFCNGDDTCDSGTCIHSGDPCPGPDGDTDCSESCDESSDSCTAPDDNGTPCDDIQFCNGHETCVDGSCQPGGYPCGDSLCDEENNACVECLEDSDCDDGLFCNGTETCQEKECRVGDDPCPGLVCDEESDQCVFCLQDSDCDDGLFCNGVEECDYGECQAGLSPCAAGEVCDEVNDTCTGCLSDSDCDDGLFCNGSETCVDGSCRAGTDPCGDIGCDEDADHCLPCFSDADCDDGVFCNGAETCVTGICQAGNDPCPGMACNEEQKRCETCTQDADCDDGLFCNGAETCVDGSCRAGSDPCGGLGCDESSDSCVGCSSDADCDDGLFCNGAETCSGGMCQAGSEPCPGLACNEENDQCQACLQDADCDDGVFCNGAETCTNGVCLRGDDPCPGPDGDDDCAESCDEQSASCNAPDPDGSQCAGGTCQQGQCLAPPASGGCGCSHGADGHSGWPLLVLLLAGLLPARRRLFRRSWDCRN